MLAIVRDKNFKEVQRITRPDKSWVIKQLDSHLCMIMFRKVKNGQFRTLNCTRDVKKLPRKFKIAYTEAIVNPHGYDNIIPVWDIMSREWKSFHYSNIINMTVYLGDKYG